MISDIEIGYIVVVVVGICEAVKYAGLKSRYIPLLAVVLGLVATYFFSSEVNWLSSFAGVMIGLATTGGYRVVKTSLLNK
jgi:hypothetical protein